MPTHRQRPRRALSTPACHASASRIAAAITTRDHASTSGVKPPATATLIMRYGTPQNTGIVAKATRPRVVIALHARSTRCSAGGGGSLDLVHVPHHRNRPPLRPPRGRVQLRHD